MEQNNHELWKEIPIQGYLVSNTGKIKSFGMKRQSNRPNRKRFIRTFKPKVLSPGDNGRGYLGIRLGKSSTTFYMHRLVAQAFIPNPKNHKEVNHKDGNKKNNHVSNLEWCDRKTNLAHAREVLGFTNSPKTRKFDFQQIIEIKQTYLNGLSMIKISKKFGCSLSTIQDILHHKTYRAWSSPDDMEYIRLEVLRRNKTYVG